MKYPEFWHRQRKLKLLEVLKKVWGLEGCPLFSSLRINRCLAFAENWKTVLSSIFGFSWKGNLVKRPVTGRSTNKRRLFAPFVQFGTFTEQIHPSACWRQRQSACPTLRSTRQF